LRERVLNQLAEIAALVEGAREQADLLIAAAQMIAEAFAGGKKVLLFGNGGSAADAQHVAAEFVNRFLIERPPLPAVALTTDSSILTSIANDYDFSEVFAKQIKAIGQSGDVAWGITTSGRSPNVLEGLRAARDRQMKTIVLTGGNGGEATELADLLLTVDGALSTPRVQEVHLIWEHIICDLVDYIFFQRPSEEDRT